MKAIVVTYDLRRGISAHDDVPWRHVLPANKVHFRELTTGGSIIMGRKTFESIGRVLAGRQNIVVSRSPLQIAGVDVVGSLDEAYAVATGPIFVIGGESIYRQALVDVDMIFATEVLASFPDVDLFFPELGAEWQEISREHHDKAGNDQFDCDFVVYRRVSP